ncbi:MAG: sulfatase-like hydrolase/transferase [Planctomycetaceae bacterium]
MKRLALIALFILPAGTLAEERPNILLLFADDQRADTVGAWGNPNIDTPNIDALVGRGFSFKQNYCFGSNSGAVCVPSRAMLHTGKHWMHSNNQMKGETTLGQLLQTEGYKTFCTGKWHNGAPSILKSFEHGKAVYMGGMCDHIQVPLQDIEGGKLVNKRFGDGFSSTLFADAMIGFMENHKSDEPFFAYAAFTSPHDPRQPPEPYRQKYYDKRPPLPANFAPQHPFNNGFMTGRDESLAPWPRPKDVVSDQLAEYYGMVEHLDMEIGRVIKALEATGKADNTIIIYAADHGLAMGSHGLLGKQSVYEHSMRCPLVFVGDGIPAGKSTNAFTYLLDIYPTIMSLTHTKPKQAIGFDGEDLSPIWKGTREKVRDEIYLQYTKHQRSVREERWKLIRYPQINHTQLFDLQNDPNEMKNLAESSDHKAHVDRLMEKLANWQTAWGDDLPLTSDNPKPKAMDFTNAKRVPDRWQPKWIRDKYYGGTQPNEGSQKQIRKMMKEFGQK